MWVDNLNTEDEKVLLNGDWLNDKLINAGQMLIKESYPQVYGFKDASLGQTLGFDVLTEEFVQVLHTGRGHWVTISTIGCSIAEVDIFDSMPPAISSSLQNQIGKHLVHSILISCYYVIISITVFARLSFAFSCAMTLKREQEGNTFFCIYILLLSNARDRFC